MTIPVPAPPQPNQINPTYPPLTSKDKKWYVTMFIVINLLLVPPTAILTFFVGYLGYSLIRYGLDTTMRDLGIGAFAVPVMLVLWGVLGFFGFGLNYKIYTSRRNNNPPHKKTIIIVAILVGLVYAYNLLGILFAPK